MRRVVIFAVLVALCGFAFGADAPVKERFLACESHAVAGFFWVDTTSGATWRADPGSMAWVYCGVPKGAQAGRVGTYIPYEYKTGDGVFVLNTVTGHGWWTDGKTWKDLGIPGTKEG